MVSYNNSSVMQCLRQYDMFASSLNLVKTREEKDMIIKQLTKLENKVISLTNELYEEEYYSLANKECGLIEDEQNRLNMLVELINQRLLYIEKRCNNHYQLTGETIDVSDVLGSNELVKLEERIKIINKYSKNVKLEKELKQEVESLSNKITLASEKIEINKSLNHELEKTFCDVLFNAFEECGFNSLIEIREEIEYAYYETEKSLTLAELNLETAKTSPLNVLSECQSMFDEVKKDYIKYKEKLNLLKLIDIYSKDVNSYEELLFKRKEVNELFRYIRNEKFLDLVLSVVNKQYNTILMEQQDINTYNDLVTERDRKMEALAEIELENESDKFREVLEELIKNEQILQNRLLEEQKRIEEEEKKRKLELERKKQEEILKRQKIIEEARKKEMEKRTRELLEQQQKSVLQTKKKDNSFNFETMKEITAEKVEENSSGIFVENKHSEEDEKDTDMIMFKDKVDIEKELFDEFNNNSKKIEKMELNFSDEDENEKLVEESRENKLPDGSIDDYMKNFKETDFDKKEINSLFDDELFPNIPL